MRRMWTNVSSLPKRSERRANIGPYQGTGSDVILVGNQLRRGLAGLGEPRSPPLKNSRLRRCARSCQTYTRYETGAGPWRSANKSGRGRYEEWEVRREVAPAGNVGRCALRPRLDD